MFVKIVYRKRKDKDGKLRWDKIGNETVYDVCSYSIFPTNREDNKPPNEMNLVLRFNKDAPREYDNTISFPMKQENIAVEIFIMNNQGKTIHRYIY